MNIYNNNKRIYKINENNQFLKDYNLKYLLIKFKF